MEAEYRISEDYARAVKLGTKISPNVMAIYSSGLAILIMFSIFGKPDIQAAAIAGLIGGTATIAICRYLVSPIVTRRHYKKYKAMQVPFKVQLLDDGVRFLSEDGEWKLPWAKILQWRQNERYLLIYSNPALFYVVPKSIEANGFDISALTSQLSKHVGAAA